MTGSVPSIALSPISPSRAATRQVVAPKPLVRPQVQRKSVVVVVVVTVSAAWVHLRFINRVWRERRMLARLDDRALKDIGLNRADVERETGRSPFDLPTRRNRWE